MADPIIVSGPVSGTDKTLTFETGKLAPQSRVPSWHRIGGTKVLTTANAAKSVRDGIDFFPLTVDVEERAYAAGKIPGSFFRREGRPTEDAILTCRLTDRPLRPSFPDGFRNETQVVTTVLGADQHNPHDVLSINAASAALMIWASRSRARSAPCASPTASTASGSPHPTYEEGEAGTFELVVAGRELDNGDVAVMMVEAGGSEKSFDYYDDGAQKVDRGRPRRRPRGLQGVDQGVDRPAASARRLGHRHRRPDHADEVHARSSTTRRRSSPPSRGAGTDKLAPVDHDRRQVRAQRRHRRRHGRDRRRAVRHQGRARRVRRPERDGQRGRPLAHQEAGAQARRRRGRPHRRPWRRRPASGLRRSRRAADRARLRPVPAWRDPGDERAARWPCRA